MEDPCFQMKYIWNKTLQSYHNVSQSPEKHPQELVKLATFSFCLKTTESAGLNYSWSGNLETYSALANSKE